MWTRISSTVPASTAAVPSRTINLQEAVQWSPGDKIVLVTTAWKGQRGQRGGGQRREKEGGMRGVISRGLELRV